MARGLKRLMWMGLGVVIGWGVVSTWAFGQVACVCVSGCKIVADSYPPPVSAQPTTCTVYKGGVVIASAPVVAASSIASSNASVCQPAAPLYNAGPGGSVACLVPISGQAAGSVTLTMTASNAAGETAQSQPFTFQSVSTLATVPQVPVNVRVSP